MRIVGFVETSLVDWDGRITMVIFIGGCNFHCPFCHNPKVAADSPELHELHWPALARIPRSKPGWVDGVVVTGGEPMMHPEIFDLCRKIRAIGLKVKIDTNGSFPYALKQLIELKLCDFVAMDVKAPLNDKYRKAAGRDVDFAVLRRSIRLLKESGIGYEFRTTLVPGIVEPEDLSEIAKAVEGANLLVLQQFIPQNARTEELRRRKVYSLSQAEELAAAARHFVKQVKLRGKFL
ncbi:MAG: anaerobic ribonucleoside-triphosphate reductase activating protein [candidate division WOR-3 bacterium]